MALEDRKLWGETHRAIGSAVTDSTNGPCRIGRYGEQYTQSVLGSKIHALADEGSYFVVKNATTGTGIATTAAVTSYDATKGFLALYNTSTTNRVYLDYLRLQCTAAGTAGASLSYDMVIDTGSRLTSGGTAITSVNPNIGSSASCPLTGSAGALTTTAATANVRKICGGQLRSVIPVVGDQYLFTFGSSASAFSSLATAGTATANIALPAPPIILDPLTSFVLHLWLPSQSAASSYEYELGCWAR